MNAFESPIAENWVSLQTVENSIHLQTIKTNRKYLTIQISQCNNAEKVEKKHKPKQSSNAYPKPVIFSVKASGLEKYFPNCRFIKSRVCIWLQNV